MKTSIFILLISLIFISACAQIPNYSQPLLSPSPTLNIPDEEILNYVHSNLKTPENFYKENTQDPIYYIRKLENGNYFFYCTDNQNTLSLSINLPKT
jgi:hypothetical protein